MSEEKIKPKELSMSNTKKEMLDVYNILLKQLQEKREAELKPEKKIEEKKISGDFSRINRGSKPEAPGI